MRGGRLTIEHYPKTPEDVMLYTSGRGREQEKQGAGIILQV